MLCYKDRTFCASRVHKHTCGRELTQKDKDAAGEMKLPIAWAYFCGEPANLKRKGKLE